MNYLVNDFQVLALLSNSIRMAKPITNLNNAFNLFFKSGVVQLRLKVIEGDDSPSRLSRPVLVEPITRQNEEFAQTLFELIIQGKTAVQH